MRKKLPDLVRQIRWNITIRPRARVLHPPWEAQGLDDGEKEGSDVGRPEGAFRGQAPGAAREGQMRVIPVRQLKKSQPLGNPEHYDGIFVDMAEALVESSDAVEHCATNLRLIGFVEVVEVLTHLVFGKQLGL